MCLTLNLSHNLTVTDFGKLITFQLNVTLISFQATSKMIPNISVCLILPCLVSAFL